MNEQQRSVNDAEWHNPDNWSGIGPFKAYFSKRDSRILVHLFRSDGWSGPHTLNFGHRWGMLSLVIISMTFVAMVVGVGLTKR